MKILPNSNCYFVFSGGEVHCRIDRRSCDGSRIVCKDYSMNGFMALAEIKEILSRDGRKVELVYPYLPYARQDRVIEPNEPFSLKVFAKLLNSLEFSRVIIWDPHSDVVPALINNCSIVPQWKIAHRILPMEILGDAEIMWVSPDVGAYKKISKFILDDNRIITGLKQRDPDGKIIRTRILYDTTTQKIYGKTCVLVDDICDGGRTFIELAKLLKECGAKHVILCVTHGIFSQGLPIILEHIDEIYTTNSFPHQHHPNLHTIELDA